jgi:hypothetical protein
MQFADKLAENRRLIILRALAEATGYKANETVLRQGLDMFGHQVGRDQVRADIAWLAEHNLLRTEVLNRQDGDFIIAHLLDDGEEVAKGRYHPGVARRGPE